MANSPSRTGLVAGVGVAVAALLMINLVNQRLDPKEQERLAKERDAAQAQKAAKEAAANPKPTPAGGEGELAKLGDDAQLGSAGGQPEIVVSYEWTPEVQGNPELVYGAVRQVQSMSGGASIRVVNRDARADAPPPGVYVDGKNRATVGTDGSLTLITGRAPSTANPSGTASPSTPAGGAAPAPQPPTSAVPTPNASPTPGSVLSAPDR